MVLRQTTAHLPTGARFYACALQVNPYAYLVRHAKRTSYAAEADYNSAIVSSCLANGVEVIGVADHYRINTSQSLIATAVAAGLVVLPGFEAVTKDGVHLLCLFDEGTTASAIERRIGECGIGEEDNAISPLGKLDSGEFLERCTDWKAVCIAAHVAAAGGLLKTLKGQSAVNVWRSPDLLACGLPGPVADAPPEIRPILENSNPHYRRARPVAVINAQDVNDPADLKRPGFVTAVKMSSVGFEGLKQAFLDPDSRIRLATDPAPAAHTEFLAIEWTGGFLDGVGLRFNENLNVLIGGRGTGKSSVVESIRYVLGLDPVGSDAGDVHAAVVKHVLRAGTQISLVLRSPYPVEREYVVQRTVPNPPIVRTADGEVLAVAPADVAPRVEVYGQHEISEIARSSDERTRLLERFLETDEASADTRQLARDLAQARERVIELQRGVAERDEKLGALPALKETLRRYEEAGLEDKLREKSLMVREEALLKQADVAIAAVEAGIDEFAELLPIDTSWLAADALTDLPNAELLKRLEGTLGTFSSSADKQVAELRAAAARATQSAKTIRDEWDRQSAAVDQRYEETLRDLQKTNVDGDEFIRLRRQIELLAPLGAEKRSLLKELKDVRASREATVIAFEEAKAADFRALERAAKKVNKKLAGTVRVKLRYQGNVEPLLELLRTVVGGRLQETCDVLRKKSNLSLRALADAARSGSAELTRLFALLETQAARIADAGDDLSMRIEELELLPTTELELNVAREGEPENWRALEELSAGQKATAVLLLLLLESDAPLIIDQPEDDLDNRFITEGVVPRMREEKRRRQFIFSTHNANIPVLGDAELIAALTATGGQATIEPEDVGSIDVPRVRELVEELLEGGKDAFEFRRLKYGF